MPFYASHMKCTIIRYLNCDLTSGCIYLLTAFPIVVPQFWLHFRVGTVRVRCHSQCLKVTEKVSFNIASEASFVFISLKMGNFGDCLKNSVTRHVTFDWTTIDGKCQNLKN